MCIDNAASPLQLCSQVRSGSEERGRLDEMGSQVAQLRERLSELDRAVTALTDAGAARARVAVACAVCGAWRRHGARLCTSHMIQIT